MTPTACCAPALFNVHIVPVRTLKSPGNCVCKCNVTGQRSKILLPESAYRARSQVKHSLQHTFVMWRTFLNFIHRTADFVFPLSPPARSFLEKSVLLLPTNESYWTVIGTQTAGGFCTPNSACCSGKSHVFCSNCCSERSPGRPHVCHHPVYSRTRWKCIQIGQPLLSTGGIMKNR